MALQVVLVSATLPVEVLDMTNKFMNQPLKVMVKRDELTLEVRQASSCMAPHIHTLLLLAVSPQSCLTPIQTHFGPGWQICYGFPWYDQ